MQSDTNTIFQHANWIFAADASVDVVNTYFDFQTTFSLTDTADLTLHLCAHTRYAVYVNDRFVDCGQYPGYEDYQVYDSLNLSGFVTPGENTLRIAHYVAGADFLTVQKQIPGVIFALWQGDTCLLTSTPDVLSRKNTHYADGNMEVANDVLGFVFKYDACTEELPYRKSVLVGKEKHLFPRPIKKCVLDQATSGRLTTQGVFLADHSHAPMAKTLLCDYLSNRTKRELLTATDNGTAWQVKEDEAADGVYFLFDMGQESAGYLNLDFEVPEACDVLIGWGEHVDDLRIRSRISNRNFTVSYRAKAGRNQFFDPFLRMGLRYLQVHIASRSGVLHTAGIRFFDYPMNIRPNTIRDGLHHRIYDVAVRTLHMCIHEHHEDCPWREQSLYTFDSRVQMLAGYYAFDREFDVARESLRLLGKNLRADGHLEIGAPGKFSFTIPSFTTIYIRQLLEYMEYSGDKDFIQEMFPVAKTIVEMLEGQMDETGLLPSFVGKQYWNFYSWNAGLSGNESFLETAPYECALNAFASDSFHCFARLCEVVQPELAAHYDALHKKLNVRLHEAFFDPEQNLYMARTDGANPAHYAFLQVLPLYVGATPEELRPTVIENMLKPDMIPCMLSARTYEYDVLLQEDNKYREFVRRDVEKTWGHMLFSGATSFWEVVNGEGGDFDQSCSLCHGWSGMPIYLYGKYNLLNE